MNGTNAAGAGPRLRVHGTFGRAPGASTAAPGPAVVSDSGTVGAAEDAPKRRALRRSAGPLEVAAFANDFKTMLGAGLGVPEILGIIARGSRRQCPSIAAALEDVRRDVEQGRRLVEAFDPHRRLFGDLCVEMIGAGEQTGRLEQYLADIAADCEQRHKNRSTVLSALVEPALIVGVGLAVSYVILTFTVPQFKVLYQALTRGGGLPLPTRALIALADALASPAGVLGSVSVLLAAAGTGIAVRRVESLRYRAHALALRTPVLGDLVLKDAVARGCRTLGVVVKTIGDVPTAMRLAAKTCPTLPVAAAFEYAAELVQQGRAIAASLEATGVFPDMCVSMVETGERSGALDELLPKLAEGYETQVRFARERLLMLIRPALVVVMGALVLGIMLAMYMPIFSLIDQMRR